MDWEGIRPTEEFMQTIYVVFDEEADETQVQKLGEILAERRLVTEGIVASTTNRNEVRMKQQEDTRGILQMLSAFFDA